MGIFSKLKATLNPHYEPLVCKPADIFDLIREGVEINAPLVNLVVEINGKQHKIGVTSDYDRCANKFFDIAYFLDDSEFTTLEELIEKAEIDFKRFAELETVTVLEDTEAGDPRNYTLLEKREIK